MAQGFVRNLNFQESDTGALDRGILDNLGGLDITNDLLLFDGNTKFISKLVGTADVATTDYTVAANVVTVTGEGKVAFSDGTKLSVAAAPTDFNHTVFNSNGVDKFQVKNSSNVTITPSGVLRRNDTVTGINLGNLSVKRLPSSYTSSSGSFDGDSGGDVFNSFGINSQVAYIEGQIGLFYYKRGRIPRNYELSTFSQAITFNGGLTIKDSAATGSSTPNNTTPGLFIVDANAPATAPVRAFSDSSNPWSEVTNALHTDEDNAVANVLNIEPSGTYAGNVPNIECVNAAGSSATLLVTTNTAVSAATKKLAVQVNGEPFFLLLAPA